MYFIHIHIIPLFSDLCCFLWVVVIHNSYLCSLTYNISFFSSKCFTIYLWLLLLGLWYAYIWVSSCLPSILENSHLLMLIFFSLLSLLSFLISTYTMLDHFVLSLKSLGLHLFLFPTFFSSCLAIWKISIEPSSGSLVLFSVVSSLQLSLSKGSLFQILYFSV